MLYCYAKLSKFDLLLFRAGGPGLGNLLFPWARAKVISETHNYRMLASTWPQVKIGPILRGELDARNYAGIFKTVPNEVSGFKRLWILLTRKRVSEFTMNNVKSGQILEFEGMEGMYEAILGHSEFLRNSLISMLARNRISDLTTIHNCKQSIAVHVRFGDFSENNLTTLAKGQVNCRQPIEWYVAAVCSLRKELGADVIVNIFSDAIEEELKPLMALPLVRRISGNTAIEDMLLIGTHKVFVASGSTFSMWGSFLGQLPTIWFLGQKKFNLLVESDSEIEYEVGDDLSKFCESIKT